MVFTSLAFVVFFATLFLIYYAVPGQFRWRVLLAWSLFFYAYMTPYYLVFLLLTVVVTYLSSVALDDSFKTQRAWLVAQEKTLDRAGRKAYKGSMENKRRRIVAGVVFVLIGLLVVFKYLDFLFVNVNWLGECWASISS